MKHDNRTRLLASSPLEKYKNQPPTTSPNLRASKKLLPYYRRFQDLSINETNYLLYYIQETTSPKIRFSLSFLTKFCSAHSHDLSGHPSREKIHATVTEKYYFPNIKTWIAIIT